MSFDEATWLLLRSMLRYVIAALIVARVILTKLFDYSFGREWCFTWSLNAAWSIEIFVKKMFFNTLAEDVWSCIAHGVTTTCPRLLSLAFYDIMATLLQLGGASPANVHLDVLLDGVGIDHGVVRLEEGVPGLGVLHDDPFFDQFLAICSTVSLDSFRDHWSLVAQNILDFSYTTLVQIHLQRFIRAISAIDSLILVMLWKRLILPDIEWVFPTVVGIHMALPVLFHVAIQGEVEMGVFLIGWELSRICRVLIVHICVHRLIWFADIVGFPTKFDSCILQVQNARCEPWVIFLPLSLNLRWVLLWIRCGFVADWALIHETCDVLIFDEFALIHLIFLRLLLVGLMFMALGRVAALLTIMTILLLLVFLAPLNCFFLLLRHFADHLGRLGGWGLRWSALTCPLVKSSIDAI